MRGVSELREGRPDDEKSDVMWYCVLYACVCGAHTTCVNVNAWACRVTCMVCVVLCHHARVHKNVLCVCVGACECGW